MHATHGAVGSYCGKIRISVGKIWAGRGLYAKIQKRTEHDINTHATH
jgi:hypothetical protein